GFFSSRNRYGRDRPATDPPRLRRRARRRGHVADASRAGPAAAASRPARAAAGLLPGRRAPGRWPVRPFQRAQPALSRRTGYGSPAGAIPYRSRTALARTEVPELGIDGPGRPHRRPLPVRTGAAGRAGQRGDAPAAGL